MGTQRMLNWILRSVIILGLSVGAAVGPAAARELPVVKPVIDCAALAETDIAPPGEAPARIVTAKMVAGGSVIPYCEVRGYVAPQVKFELRLPTQNWMQRLMFSGCGGFCGRIDFRVRAAEGCAAIDNGEFALVASDLGHDAPDGNGDGVWAASNPQGAIDYGHRGVHVVTVAAKAIIARFYGRPQSYSYFNGCSDGGREGMMEVQRYPDDFDGVVAGAAVINDTANNSIFHAWSTQHLRRADGTPLFSDQALAVLHAAVIAACDKLGDGVADGVIGDPAACRFDPATVACRGEASATCLSPEQVAAARAIYSGPLDPDGRPLYFGRPFGTELDWNRDVSPFVRSFIRYMAAPDPQPYDLADVGYDAETVGRYNARAAIYNATDPDIRAFQRGGGKLIMWHGWSDSAVPPMSSVDYYRAVRKAVGSGINDFVRLYMLPGVGHCGGGDGPDKLNLVDAITAWVEDGKEPGAIQLDRKSFGRTLQSRPVYPYPAVARYKGTGNPDAAASFSLSD